MKMNHAVTIAAACLAAAASLAMPGVAHSQNVHYPAGKSMFDAQCAVCHQAGGKYSTTAPGRAQLTSTVVHGMFGEIKVHDKSYNFKMPSFASASDEDLAQVLNYVVFDLNAQHGDAKPFTAADIKAARAQSTDSSAVHSQRAVVIKGLGL
jgi:mono/diheme cytochrome c family protein